ncbi:Prostaglandin E synthase 3 (Cytosolic) [Dermatophagoides farinae]|uniref:Prostaglandin E synthase 3 (Cytosolic) n=1 Tax=Dermatophagoides farinae TaxID=6954 RepID=A0A922HPY3_DERFA|nr:Prostaglandin E synthase 3 (Cytosolic) [Dermatophagoides farinae]
MTSIPAPLKWAQRKDLVYLNFQVQDVVNPEVVVEKDKIIYRAETKDKQKYESILNLYGEIKPEESKWINRDRGAEFVLIKTESGPYWKRLLKEDTKYHWLKVDFNRWKDEDESDDEAGGGGTNFEDMMRQMGGLGGGMGGMGMPGMGGMGMPGMGGMGMPGMGGMGMPGMGGNFDDLEDDEKDSDDENIPDLEDGDDAKKNGDDNKNSNKE